MLVAGAEGRQFRCYTNTKFDYVQPKAPGGGGFGCIIISLQYLYHQFLAHQNIWTTSNDYMDLVRYTGCKLTVYRHPTTDFILHFDRQPPFLVEKETYMNIHPANLLLRKNKIIVLSQQSKPNGRLKKTFKVKPPKQMVTKWFFQEDFTEHGLLMLSATACNFNYSQYSQTSQSNSLTFYSISTQFYANCDWDNDKASAYTPWATVGELVFTYPTKGGGTAEFTKPAPAGQGYEWSVNRETGYFCNKILTATSVKSKTGQQQHNLPITIARYNPNQDTGNGSKVWLISNFSNTYNPPLDVTLKMEGRPLWMMLYGFWDYIQKTKHASDFMNTHMFVIESPAIQLITPHTQTKFPFVDFEFTIGNLAYDEYITPTMKQMWVPNALKQHKTINQFVECGPFIPKYSQERESTWELKYNYSFYFKWGGPHQTNPDVSNPKNQGKYPVPDTELQTVQVSDPLKQSYKKMLRAWDYRRGIITTTALKRIQQDTETESSFSSSPEKKKKKTFHTGEPPTHQEKTEEINSCLLSLCEENTYQEEEKDLHKLILNQQQQQHKLKQNLFKLLLNLKQQQRKLQLQTGLLD